MIAPAGAVALLLILGFAIAATLPWTSDDVEWFEVSALLEAVLLGAVLIALA
jgi:hypothetical protein